MRYFVICKGQFVARVTPIQLTPLKTHAMTFSEEQVRSVVTLARARYGNSGSKISIVLCDDKEEMIVEIPVV